MVLDSLVRGLQRFAPGILGVLRLTRAQVWPVTVLSHVRRCSAMSGDGRPWPEIIAHDHAASDTST